MTNSQIPTQKSFAEHSQHSPDTYSAAANKSSPSRLPRHNLAHPQCANTSSSPSNSRPGTRSTAPLPHATPSSRLPASAATQAHAHPAIPRPASTVALWRTPARCASKTSRRKRSRVSAARKAGNSVLVAGT